MPFGRHKGKPIADVPRGYLRWLKNNVNLFGPLQAHVDAVLLGTHLANDDDDAAVHRVVKPWSPSDGEQHKW